MFTFSSYLWGAFTWFVLIYSYKGLQVLVRKGVCRNVSTFDSIERCLRLLYYQMFVICEKILWQMEFPIAFSFFSAVYFRFCYPIFSDCLSLLCNLISMKSCSFIIATTYLMFSHYSRSFLQDLLPIAPNFKDQIPIVSFADKGNASKNFFKSETWF